MTSSSAPEEGVVGEKSYPLLKREREWREAEEGSREARVVVRLDRVSVEPLKDGGYRIVIEGFNLYPRVAPPVVTVGNVSLERIQYERNGRRIEGVLRDKPGNGPITIDYGYAAAELKGEICWVRAE
jgi:hypothetical protein